MEKLKLEFLKMIQNTYNKNDFFEPEPLLCAQKLLNKLQGTNYRL